jgi:hypothetical protein
MEYENKRHLKMGKSQDEEEKRPSFSHNRFRTCASLFIKIQ